MAMLKSPSQYRKISEARAVVGWLAREFGCVTLSDVGRLVSRDIGSISSAVHRLSNRMLEDPELAEKIQSLKESVKKLSILEA
jgi:chromosomal replication initiation ATPase DnaA